MYILMLLGYVSLDQTLCIVTLSWYHILPRIIISEQMAERWTDSLCPRLQHTCNPKTPACASSPPAAASP